MPLFYWEGMSGNELRKGEMEADSRSAVIVRLREMQIRPIPNKITQKTSFLNLNISFDSVSENDVIVFTNQLSTIVDSGMPLVKGLESLVTQQKSQTFRKAIINIKESIESGKSFAEALSGHPKIFPEIYVSLVRAGETGGVLPEVLKRLAVYMEKMQAIKRKIKGAMIYPAVVILVAGGVVGVLLIFVIPTFSKMFEELGTTLPLLTQVIVDLSYFTKNNVLYIIIASVILFMALGYSYRRYVKVRRLFDLVMLKIPLIGELIRKTVVARVCRTLSSLTSSGIPITDGLKTASSTSGNLIVVDMINDMERRIKRGDQFSTAMSKNTDVFPIFVSQMVSVGEDTGSLDTMLGKIADFYEEEVDVAVSNLTVAIEPILMVFIGVVVGTIVIAMYLPMFKLISTLS